MPVFTKTLKLRTPKENALIDISAEVRKAVSESKFSQGVATCFVVGSTASITTIEFEPGLEKDFPRALEKIAPAKQDYAHHATWHDDNGRSHVRASLIKPDLSVPFIGGKLVLGTWQQIVLMEHDTRGRSREIIVSVVGD